MPKPGSSRLLLSMPNEDQILNSLLQRNWWDDLASADTLSDTLAVKQDSLKAASDSAGTNPGKNHRWFFRVKFGGSSGVSPAKSATTVLPGETLASGKQLITGWTKNDTLAGYFSSIYGSDSMVGGGGIAGLTPNDTLAGNFASLMDKSTASDTLTQSIAAVIPPPSNFKMLTGLTADDTLAGSLAPIYENKQQPKDIIDLGLALAGLMDSLNASPDNSAGEMIFDSSRGDILGTPYIRLSTYQHATAKFIINDPDDSIRKQLMKHSSVEIEAGFVDGFKLNKFTGVIYSLARRFPDGCEVECVDNASKLQTSAPPVQTNQGQTPELTVSNNEGQEEKVVGTFEGDASFYGGGDGFDGKKTASGQLFDTKKLTAAHKTLPFGTRVYVTNIATKKSVVVTINDRGPYSGGRVLDLSKAAAEAIGMVASGHARVKAEILAPQSADAKAKPSPATAATATKAKPIAPSAAYQPAKPIEDTKSGATTNAENTKAQMTELANKNPKYQVLNSQVQTKDADLKFKDQSPMKVPGKGTVQVQGTVMDQANRDAKLQGDVVVARGNTVIQVAPGQAESSGLILDYQSHRSTFIEAYVKKRTGVQLQSGYGAYTVTGYNPNDKTTVSATAVNPAPDTQHPTGVIQVPDWGKIKVSDPIVPGGIYTWGDATKNGSRVPPKNVMEGIAQLAPYLEQWTKEIGKGKWTIKSWYRDPASNRSAGGATKSSHMVGIAVDVFFPGCFEWHKKMAASWDGGVAIDPGVFVHVDLNKNPPRRRWTY